MLLLWSVIIWVANMLTAWFFEVAISSAESISNVSDAPALATNSFGVGVSAIAAVDASMASAAAPRNNAFMISLRYEELPHERAGHRNVRFGPKSMNAWPMMVAHSSVSALNELPPRLVLLAWTKTLPGPAGLPHERCAFCQERSGLRGRGQR